MAHFDLYLTYKTDEQIEMPFGMWSRMDPNYVLRGSLDPPGEGVFFGGGRPFNAASR